MCICTLANKSAWWDTGRAAGCRQLDLHAKKLPFTCKGLPCLQYTGHRHQLRTLVDEHILQHTPDQLLCAGGGTADVQLLLEVEQLLAATAGEAGSFSTSKMQAVKTASRTEAFQQQQEQQLLQQQQMLDQATFLHLPLPWADGDECVELVGVLAQRRRYASSLVVSPNIPSLLLRCGGCLASLKCFCSWCVPCQLQLHARLCPPAVIEC